MTSALASVDSNVRAVVNALLAARDLSRDDLARGTGIHPGTIKRRMSKTPGPGHTWTAAEVQALSDFFGVSLSGFYAGPTAMFSGGGVLPSTSGYSGEIPTDSPIPAADLLIAA